ncbi:putative spanin, inner membrane subunit [Cylindrospermopsis phage Cr-LKS3]|nr:putative spanin, inner membrane subunit [Cylindrospermopsis phage Cr-LKS3]
MLGSTLVLSLSGNAWLLLKLGAAREKAEGEIATAVQRGRAEALSERADQLAQLVSLAELDRSLLLQELTDIAERARTARVVYRDRIASLPAPTCAPGQERMDAVNALVGGE